MIKLSILPEDIIIFNVCVPNKVRNYIGQKWTELQDVIDESTVLIGDFSTLLSEMAETQ